MNELILSTGQAVGELYVWFVLVLLLANSLAKLTFDNELSHHTKRIVSVVSIFVILCFWYKGALLWKLLLYGFATFGFYDFVGRYIEQILTWFFLQLYDWWTKLAKSLKAYFD